jgi:hypothetical protein
MEKETYVAAEKLQQEIRICELICENLSEVNLLVGESYMVDTHALNLDLKAVIVKGVDNYLNELYKKFDSL